MNPKLLTPKQRAAYEVLAARKLFERRLEQRLHAEQRRVWRCRAKRIAATAGRRSGKSTLLVHLVARALNRGNKQDFVGVAATTRKLAKDYYWQPLKDINEEFGLGWTFLEQDLTIHTPRGAFARLLGFDALPEIEKARGYRCALFVIDELGTISDLAEKAVNDSIGPSTIDLGGQIVLAGTPGPSLQGFWYQAASGKDPIWERFHWCFRNNPFLTKRRGISVAELEEEILRENNLTRESSRFRREYLGEWVPETSALVFSDFDATKHVTAEPHNGPRRGWSYALGVDFGVADECAWVVLGWPLIEANAEAAPRFTPTYVVHVEKKGGLAPDDVSARTADLVRLFRPVWVVGDAAGKAYILDFNKRYATELGTHITPAYKPDVPGQVMIVNGLFRGMRLLVCAGTPQVLVDELESCIWEDDNHAKIKKKQQDHALDALRYIVRHTAAMVGQVVKKPVEDPLAAFEARARKELERRAALADEELEDHWR